MAALNWLWEHAKFGQQEHSKKMWDIYFSLKTFIKCIPHCVTTDNSKEEVNCPEWNVAVVKSRWEDYSVNNRVHHTFPFWTFSLACEVSFYTWKCQWNVSWSVTPFRIHCQHNPYQYYYFIVDNVTTKTLHSHVNISLWLLHYLPYILWSAYV